MKNHVRILGGIYTVTCGLALVLGLSVCVLLELDASASSRNARQMIVPPFLLTACFGLIPGLVGGIGLLRLRLWARIPILLLSAALLPLLPIGSAIGAYGFWTLLNPEAKAFFAGSEGGAVPPSVHTPSPVLSLLGVMAYVAAGFFLALKVGFVVHHDPPPTPIDSGPLTVTAILILFLGAAAAARSALRSVGRALYDAQLCREAKQFATVRSEAYLRRVAELAADPRRAQYAPLVERGEDWSDANIAYRENPALTTTCYHLQRIEAALRSAGIQVHRYKEEDILAKCQINFPRLQRDFRLSPSIRYSEFFAGDRYEDEHPTAFLICDKHKSMIHTRHPEQGGANDAPWFPAPAT